MRNTRNCQEFSLKGRSVLKWRISRIFSEKSLNEYSLAPPFKEFLHICQIMFANKKIFTSKTKRKRTFPPMVESPDEKVTLYSYQQQGVNWMMTREMREEGGILADEMGLGKTVQIIVMMQRMINMFPEKNHDTLLILPKSILNQWKQELIDKGGFESHYFYENSRNFRKIRTQHSEIKAKNKNKNNPLIVLTTYDTLRATDTDSPDRRIFDHQWRRIILDEGHQCCNMKTKKTHAVLAITTIVTWVLTGTPIQNRIPEFVTLLYLVTRDRNILSHAKTINKPVKWEKRDEHGRKIVGQKFVAVHKNPTQQSLSELRSLRIRYLLGRTKEGVAKQHAQMVGDEQLKGLKLPELIRKDRWIQLSPEEQAEYDKMYDQFILRIKRYINQGGRGDDTAVHILAIITKLRRFCVHPLILKPDSLNSYLASPQPSATYLPPSTKFRGVFIDLMNILKKEPDSKVLIFSQWTTSLDIVQHYLARLRLPYFRLDGSTSHKDRQSRIAAFQRDDGPRIFLVSLKAGGLGLNLTRANKVFMLDLYWNEASEEQALARVHRRGQTKPVEVYRYIIRGDTSIEQLVFDLQKRKNEHIDSIFSKNTRTTNLPQLQLFYKEVLERQRQSKATGRQAKKARTVEQK